MRFNYYLFNAWMFALLSIIIMVWKVYFSPEGVLLLGVEPLIIALIMILFMLHYINQDDIEKLKEHLKGGKKK